MLDALRADDRAAVGVFGEEVAFDGDLSLDRRAVRTFLTAYMWPPSWFAGGVLWTAMDRAMSLLARASERRVLVLVSDGDDTCRREFGTACISPEAIADRARRESVMIYSVRIAGTHREEVAKQPEVAFVAPHLGVFQRPIPLDDRLPRLAWQSGGESIDLAHVAGLHAAMTRILDELRHQYLLGIATEQQHVHTVRVDATRSGLRVRSRRDYGDGR
jgi:hypothetical protein